VGTADALGAGEAVAAAAAGADDELAVGDGAGDVVADVGGVAGAAGVGGAVVVGGDVLGAAGAGLAGELAWPMPAWPETAWPETACPETACPETVCPETVCRGCEAGGWCTEAARAMPPAADAASRPTTIETIVSGRASRR
jgi:hypothetical protein